MTTALFTRFTSGNCPLAKSLSLSLDAGKLTKQASAQMVRGSFETLSLDCTQPDPAPRLAALLSGWTESQALSPSLCLSADAGKLTTQKHLSTTPGAVARDAKHFGYRAGVGGLLVLDYDPPKHAHALSPADLWAALLTLWPEAASGIVCHWVSGSSLIYTAEGEQLAGIGGQRLYLPVQTQSDIPRTLKVLNQRAWLHGLGAHVHVSTSGALLPRSLFDAAMADAGGRLDFAPAGAVCRDGLEQRRGPPTVLANGQALDTRQTLPDLSPAEAAEVAALIESAKLKAQPEAEAKRAAWLAARQQGAAIEAAKAGTDPEEARARVKREHDALLSGVLMGSAEVVHVDDKGEEHIVTVQELLKAPKDWNGKRFLSPHEPDHRGRSPDAMAYLLQAVPTLFDLNDGVRYRLQAQPVRLQAAPGNKAQLADQIAAELAARPDLMNVAGQLARVVDGEFCPVSRPLLSFLIGTHCALFKQGKEGKAAAFDVDQPTTEMVHALLTERARKVKGRSSIPLIDTKGRMIAAPGLDDTTGFYLDLTADPEPVPAIPTRAQTIEALRRLWAPWAAYQWETPHCAAAMLSMALTVPMRPTIQAAPGLFVDAANQGAGKSSAVAAILTLTQGHRGGMKSWTGDSEIELEKYLLSLAKTGAPALAFDNVLGTFDSAAIASAVIEGRVSARQLGSTTALSPTFRALWLASGNNAALGRDCGTRFLQARIACPDGQPHRKAFSFEPSEAARADRAGIVRAILTVHRAWHAEGAPRADALTTRFPDWGRTVRPMVQWLQSSGLAEAAGLCPLGDPADSILNRESASDPDADASAALFSAIGEAVGFTTPFTSNELVKLVRMGKDATDPTAQALWEAVAAYFPRSPQGPTAQALAALLKNRRDRVYGGVRLSVLPKPETREAARQGQLFAVVEV